jgi:hypothetical protein
MPSGTRESHGGIPGIQSDNGSVLLPPVTYNPVTDFEHSVHFSWRRKFMRVIALLCLLALFVCGCSSGPKKVTGPGTTLPDGLQFWDLKAGNGDAAAPGKTVSVHYTGWLTDGTKFDSSRDRDQPFHFVLGTGQVIKGWDEGVAGMKVGGQRQLRVPPTLGYGSRPVHTIPANSTLIFDVELLEVK